MKALAPIIAATLMVSVGAVAAARVADPVADAPVAMSDWMFAPTPVAEMEMVAFDGMADIELDGRSALALALVDPSGATVFEGTIRPNETILFKDQALPAISLRFEQAFGAAVASR